MKQEDRSAGADTPEASADYSDAWLEYRRRARARWLFPPLGMLALVGVGNLLGSGPVAEYVVGALIVVWFVTASVLGLRAHWWRCPHCNERYFIGPVYANSLARRCLHCGLPKWAATAPAPVPDPASKRTQDSFRRKGDRYALRPRGQ